MIVGLHYGGFSYYWSVGMVLAPEVLSRLRCVFCCRICGRYQQGWVSIGKAGLVLEAEPRVFEEIQRQTSG